MILVYTFTNTVNNKKYIGVTNNLKRRLKEHITSPHPFGRALRKYGKEYFEVSFEVFESYDDAYALEESLVTQEVVDSDDYYNCALGGVHATTLGDNNPMRNPEIIAKHSNIWSTTNNPMNNADSKRKMIESQSTRRVSVGSVVYYGVREAARKTGMSRQKLVHRLKSLNFPDHFYL
jgi:group I intron endonuclease